MTDEDRTGHLGDALTALLDGELSDDEAVVARRHLAECPACTAEMADLGQVRSWLRALPPVDPPADFTARMLGMSGDRVITNVRTRRWAGVGALVGCAAATLVVLGLATPHDPPTSPPVAHFIEAHATAGGGEPVSHLAPAVVPVSFRR